MSTLRGVAFTVTCGACGASFKLPQEIYERRVAGRVVTLICKKCKAEITVDGTKPAQPSLVPPAPEAGAAPTPVETGPLTAQSPEEQAEATEEQAKAAEEQPAAAADQRQPAEAQPKPPEVAAELPHEEPTGEEVAPPPAAEEAAAEAAATAPLAEPPTEAPIAAPSEPAPAVPSVPPGEPETEPHLLAADRVEQVAETSAKEREAPGGEAAEPQAAAPIPVRPGPGDLGVETGWTLPPPQPAPEPPRQISDSLAAALASAAMTEGVSPVTESSALAEAAVAEAGAVGETAPVSSERPAIRLPYESDEEEAAPRRPFQSRPRIEWEPKRGRTAEGFAKPLPAPPAPPATPLSRGPRLAEAPAETAPTAEEDSLALRLAELPTAEPPTAEPPVVEPPQARAPARDSEPPTLPPPPRDSPVPTSGRRPYTAEEQDALTLVRPPPEPAPAEEWESEPKLHVATAISSLVEPKPASHPPPEATSQPPPGGSTGKVVLVSILLIAVLVAVVLLVASVGSRSIDEPSTPNSASREVQKPQAPVPAVKLEDLPVEPSPSASASASAAPLQSAVPAPSGSSASSSPSLLEGYIAALNAQAEAQAGPSTGSKPFDQTGALAALDKSAAQAAACRSHGDPPGTLSVVVTFLPSGYVKSARVFDSTYEGTATGRCVTSRMNLLKIKPFDGAPRALAKTITLH